ncbi:hypothetical protein HC928_22060, partial [bacterium]|nr:hypothetical protein [bacterium]
TNINLNYTHDDVFGSRLQAQAYYWDNDVTDFPFDDRGGFIDAIVYGPFLGEAFGGRLQIETPIAQPLELLWGADYRNERNENIFLSLIPLLLMKTKWCDRWKNELGYRPISWISSDYLVNSSGMLLLI